MNLFKEQKEYLKYPKIKDILDVKYNPVFKTSKLDSLPKMKVIANITNDK